MDFFLKTIAWILIIGCIIIVCTYERSLQLQVGFMEYWNKILFTGFTEKEFEILSNGKIKGAKK